MDEEKKTTSEVFMDLWYFRISHGTLPGLDVFQTWAETWRELKHLEELTVTVKLYKIRTYPVTDFCDTLREDPSTPLRSAQDDTEGGQ